MINRKKRSFKVRQLAKKIGKVATGGAKGGKGKGKK